MANLAILWNLNTKFTPQILHFITTIIHSLRCFFSTTSYLIQNGQLGHFVEFEHEICPSDSAKYNYDTPQFAVFLFHTLRPLESTNKEVIVVRRENIVEG